MAELENRTSVLAFFYFLSFSLVQQCTHPSSRLTQNSSGPVEFWSPEREATWTLPSEELNLGGKRVDWSWLEIEGMLWSRGNYPGSIFQSPWAPMLLGFLWPGCLMTSQSCPLGLPVPKCSGPCLLWTHSMSLGLLAQLTFTPSWIPFPLQMQGPKRSLLD